MPVINSLYILTCNLGTVGNGNFCFCEAEIDIEAAVPQGLYDHLGKVGRYSSGRN